MKETTKSHLWIPETEIDNVGKKPTGRNRQYKISHLEHGRKLSQGLEQIAGFFQNTRSLEGADELNIFAFKVILQDEEDFASQKGFIENEGLTINAVKDSRQAVVSAPQDVFDELQKRVFRYRDRGTKKNFQYIREFKPFTAEDKKADSVLRLFKDKPEIDPVDVQIMLLPSIATDVRQRAQASIAKKIQSKEGALMGEPYLLTDGTAIIRASILPKSLNEIANDPYIYWIEKTVFFQGFQPSITNHTPCVANLDDSIDLDALPAIVVLDDGVMLPPGLQGVVSNRWLASGCSQNTNIGKHGTPVASRAAFGYVGLYRNGGCLKPRARIIDAQVSDTGCVPTDDMLKRIREAVKTFNREAKIFNFSYNADECIEGDEMSILGSELDLLSKKYGIRFVISSGNHRLHSTQLSLKDIISDDDSRIAPPADAMLGIAVSAVVGADYPGSLSRKNEIAPYSRRGPGCFGFYKPDLVAYSANLPMNNTPLPSDPYALCLSDRGWAECPGTSFAAPIVAGDLAQVLTVVPNGDIGLAQALLYNGATSLYDRKFMQQDEMDFASNLYGRGLSSPEVSMYSSENRVSFLNNGTMNRLTKKRVKFHVPSTIAHSKVKRGEKKIRVKVTCLAHPPVDRTKGSEYSAAYISASIHRLNAKGKLKVDNPTVSDNRNKWDTCYHFSNEFSSFASGNWEIWLELYTRWGIKDDEEIPYSLVVTVEDLTAAGNLYSETISETAGRFTQVQQARIALR